MPDYKQVMGRGQGGAVGNHHIHNIYWWVVYRENDAKGSGLCVYIYGQIPSCYKQCMLSTKGSDS